jgi:Zn finger protein HypA/HybF involved in hydrogenase expression
MKVQCKNCLPKEGIEVPELKQSDKNRLSKMKQESPIKTVKCLMDDYGLSHLESKYITTHINENYGKCNRCDFNELDQEYLNCPKCGALNFNWKIDNE